MAARPYPPLLDRIAAKVRHDSATGCWLWTGATSKKRRGQRRPHIKAGGGSRENISVARYVCAQRHGPAPSLFHEAGHTCPAGERDDCVAPDHLQWMTREENERWKVAARSARQAAGRLQTAQQCETVQS